MRYPRRDPRHPPARTLLDLAAILDEHDLARAAERAESLRLGSPTSLEELAERYPKRKGIAHVKRLTEEHRIVPTDTRSRLERRFLTFLDANELPRPLVNERLDGVTPDFRWPEQRLIVEADGFETHGTRAAFERDRARDRALTAATRSATTGAPGPRPGRRSRAR